MVDRWGSARDGTLSGHSVSQIVKERIEAVGEDPDNYGAHSLRAGFATSTAAPDWTVTTGPARHFAPVAEGRHIRFRRACTPDTTTRGRGE
jgi:hypothetical protein